MNEREMVETVAGDGLLGAYVTYARSLTAAPLVYHLATGFAVISGAVGSHVSYMGAGDTEYWPNQYSLMLGPSGMHKTTAMNIGLELMRRAVPGTVYSDQFSQEAFIVGLQRKPTRVLAVEEFATLLADMERSYMLGLKETLTKLYDPRQEFVRSLRGEKGKGEEIRIIRPCLSIIGASTADWMVSHLKEVDFISGFMPRFLLWPSDLKEPEPPGGALALADKGAKASLVMQIGRLANIVRQRPPGPNVTFEKSAIGRIERLRNECNDRLNTDSVPRELHGLYNRVGSYAAKIATMLCVSDNGPLDLYEIDRNQAERSCQLMAWLIDQAAMVFEQQIVMELYERKAQDILRIIPADGITWSNALKKSRKPAREFASIVETLVERDELAIISRESATKAGRTLVRKYANKSDTPKSFSQSFAESSETFSLSQNGHSVKLGIIEKVPTLFGNDCEKDSDEAPSQGGANQAVT